MILIHSYCCLLAAVKQLSNPVYTMQPVVKPVVCLYTRYNRWFDNRIDNRLDVCLHDAEYNRFDNRLYRVNEASVRLHADAWPRVNGHAGAATPPSARYPANCSFPRNKGIPQNVTILCVGLPVKCTCTLAVMQRVARVCH